MKQHLENKEHLDTTILQRTHLQAMAAFLYRIEEELNLCRIIR